MTIAITMTERATTRMMIRVVAIISEMAESGRGRIVCISDHTIKKNVTNHDRQKIRHEHPEGRREDGRFLFGEREPARGIHRKQTATLY